MERSGLFLYLQIAQTLTTIFVYALQRNCNYGMVEMCTLLNCTGDCLFYRRYFYETQNSRTQSRAGWQHGTERHSRLCSCSRDTCFGGGYVSSNELSETVNGPTVIEGTDLAIDSTGLPYNATTGDPAADHSQAEAEGENWKYAKISETRYALTLDESFSGDLTGVEFNCWVIARNDLSGGIYNQLVQLQGTAHATGCTFNASVFLYGQQTTIENCTLNLGLTNYCPDGRIINCNATSERYLIVSDNSNRGTNNKLTITNGESNTFVSSIAAHDGCTVVLNSGNYTSSMIESYGSGSLEINDGTYDSYIRANGSGSITINNGTFNNQCVANGTSTVTLNDGTFSSTVVASGGTLVINNGQFEKGANVVASSSEVVINNGTFKGYVLAGKDSSTGQLSAALTVNGGVFAYKPVNTDSEVYRIAADDAAFNGLASPIYVANQTATPRITMNYSGSTSHKIIAWRIDIDNAAKNHVHTDGANTLSQLLLKMANYEHSDDLHTISLDCVRSVYGQNAFTADISLTPVIDLLPSELTFNAPAGDTQASVTLGEGMPETIEIVSSYRNVETGETTTTYPTKPGTYQISVNLNSTNPPAEEDVTTMFAHRPFWNGAYHQLPYTGQEPLTSTSWQFTIEPQAPSIDPDTGVPTNPDSASSDWSYTPGEDGEKGTLEVKSDGKLDLSGQDAAVKCDVKSDGEIAGGTFEGKVETTETSTISGGTYTGEVTGSGTITGGIFTDTIGEDVTVKGGVFTEKATDKLENVTKSSVTVTGGASINNIITSEEGEDAAATAYVATETEKSQELTLTYAPETGREFYGWQSTVEGGDSELSQNTSSTSVTLKHGEETAVTYTPVVKMNESDLDVEGDQITVDLPNVTADPAPKYYRIENGEPDVSSASETLPTEAGTYGKFVALSIGAGENSIALFAADADRVVKKKGLGYYVPELLLLGETVTVESPETPDVPGGDDTPDTPADGSGAGAGAAIAVGAVAAGSAAYIIGTQVYLTSVLPEGTAIPTNKAALAAVLWNAAGKPEPQSTALFADIAADASETQKAARWCAEQGLISANGDKFSPKSYTFRAQVIKAWNQLQKTLNAEQ